MRRTHLRGHKNILKRLQIHASGFNMGLILRKLIGFGTARGLQGLRGVFGRAFSALERTLRAEFAPMVELMKFGPRAGSWLPILRSNCELIRYAA